MSWHDACLQQSRLVAAGVAAARHSDGLGRQLVLQPLKRGADELAMPVGSDRRWLVFGGVCMACRDTGWSVGPKPRPATACAVFRQALFQQSTRLGAGDLLSGNGTTRSSCMSSGRNGGRIGGLVSRDAECGVAVDAADDRRLWVHPFLALAELGGSAGSCSADCGTCRTTARFIGAIGPRSNEPGRGPPPDSLVGEFLSDDRTGRIVVRCTVESVPRGGRAQHISRAGKEWPQRDDFILGRPPGSVC